MSSDAWLKSLLHPGWVPPSPPATWRRLNEVLDDPGASVADIARVVKLDPSVSSRLLRMANSALYRRAAPVETISQTVIVLGTRAVRELALATTVVERFTMIPPGMIDMASFWRHSVACGLAARAIAARRRESAMERYFVLGLLHDLGALLLLAGAPGPARRALDRSLRDGIPLVEAEQDEFGFDHARAGAELLRSWDLPEATCEPIAFHHAVPIMTEHAVESATLNLADVIVHAMEAGSSGTPWVPRLSHAGWDLLNLPIEDLDEVVAQVDQQLDEVERIFLG